MKIASVLLIIGCIVLIACDSKAPASTAPQSKADPAFHYVAPGEFRNKKLKSDTFPDPVGWVNDFDDIFSAEEEKVLDSMINDFEKKTTIEIAVVTLDTTHLKGQTFFAYTLALANAWYVGKKDKNNGILIGLTADYELFRIQNGYGISAILSDQETQEVINNYFFRGFREKKFYKGFLSGLQELMNRLKQKLNSAGA